MGGRSGLFGRVLLVDHQLHPAGGEGAGAGGRGGLLPLRCEQLRSPSSTASFRGQAATRPAPHACRSGSHSLKRGLSLLRAPGGGHEHLLGARSSSSPPFSTCSSRPLSTSISRAGAGARRGGGGALAPPPAEPRTVPAPWVPGGLLSARRGEPGGGGGGGGLCLAPLVACLAMPRC